MGDMSREMLPCSIVSIRGFNDLARHDILLIITTSIDHPKLLEDFSSVSQAIHEIRQHDKSAETSVSLLIGNDFLTKRVIISPTGPLNRDEDDVRRFSDATAAAVTRALKAGCKRPALLVLCDTTKHQFADSVSVLAALQTLYVPLEIREDVPDKAKKVDELGVWTVYNKELDNELNLLKAIESGRLVCRDIGGSDPERMAAPRVETYVRNLFHSSLDTIKVNVVSNDGNTNQLDKEYPLLAAVNRCAKGVERHRGRVIHLEYSGPGEITQTIGLVGKGVTYDTGGADIKAGGVMAGMHRDKCGAAAVAGFFQFLNAYRPPGIRVLGMMAMVRNSVGSDCYVSDELHTTRAGVRVRVGNTDAEGRMAMADPLCHMKERLLELKAQNAHIYTVATLTGHAIRAMGPNYTIVLDNGPAREQHHAYKFQTAGELMGEPVEVSTIRREDYEFVTGKSEYEDLLQANNAPSTMTNRGHQFPAAFMIRAAGLDKHGIDSNERIRYSHLDIAGSSGPFPGVPTGAPIVALVSKYFKFNK